MRRTHRAVALVGVVFSIAGLSFFGPSVGLSVLAGATIAALNLVVLSRTVRNMVDGGGTSWAGVAVLKFLVLLAVTYGLIQYKLAGPLALAVGFGALPFGILLAGTFSGSRSDDSFPGGASASLASAPASAGSPVSSTPAIENDHA